MSEIELGTFPRFLFARASELRPESILLIATANHDATHLNEEEVVELIGFLKGLISKEVTDDKP